MDHPVLVYTTWPNPDVAEATGRKLVENRLAACVNILPGMSSIFSWKDRIEATQEIVMIVKTRRARLNDAMAAISAAHPYETSSILAIPVIAADPAYAQWIAAETAE